MLWQIPADLPADLITDVVTEINASSILQPVIDIVQPFLKTLSVLVGGLFGLYIILLFIRIHYERKKMKILMDIRFDLDELNEHYGLLNSMKRKGLVRRMIERIKPSVQEEHRKDDSKKNKK